MSTSRTSTHLFLPTFWRTDPWIFNDFPLFFLQFSALDKLKSLIIGRRSSIVGPTTRVFRATFYKSVLARRDGESWHMRRTGGSFTGRSRRGFFLVSAMLRLTIIVRIARRWRRTAEKQIKFVFIRSLMSWCQGRYFFVDRWTDGQKLPNACTAQSR